MIVVGNSDNFGKRHVTSQITDPSYGTQIFAPGVDVSCADARSASTGGRINTGTSFCKLVEWSPRMSGLGGADVLILSCTSCGRCCCRLLASYHR